LLALNGFRAVRLVKMKDVMQIFLTGAKGKKSVNIPACCSSSSSRSTICDGLEVLLCTQGSTPWEQVQDIVSSGRLIGTLAG